MKQLFNYLKDFWRQEKNAGYFLTVALFLAVLVGGNYYFDFESSILKKFKRTWYYFPMVWIYYAVPYYFASVTYAFFYKSSSFIIQKRFWIISSLGLAFLAFNESFRMHYRILELYISPGPPLYFLKKVVGDLVSFATLFVPIATYWYIKDSKKMPLYGLTAHKFDISPYFIMLIAMLPLIIIASFNEGFLDNYPVYKDYGAHTNWGIPEFWNVVLFELGYSIDFITVELFFRGFLILALAECMGMAVIVPMATLYCIFHFGKPMGEAISSIFGGLILGIFAYNSRSIYGGILIHISVAMCMELAAYLQK